MSMHDVEYATEVLVEAVVGTQISNEAKRAALMQLFEAEDRCDVGFCRLRYYEALESCGFSAFIPREDVPEDLVRKVSYWEDFDDGEYAYVDRTFAIWEELERRSMLAPYMKEKPDASPDTPDFSSYESVLHYLKDHSTVFSDAAQEDDDYFFSGIERTAELNGLPVYVDDLTDGDPQHMPGGNAAPSRHKNASRAQEDRWSAPGRVLRLIKN